MAEEKIRLSDLIKEGKLNIRNVRDLPVTPKMPAANLQEAFDQDTENLVEAIDTYIIDKMATQKALDDLIIGTGNGDMQRSAYAAKDERGEYIPGVVEAAKSIAGSALGDVVKAIANIMYPVGAIKITVENINPSGYLGGEWRRWGEGCAIVGVKANDADFGAPEKTGGSRTHTHAIAASTSGATTLTTSQIPVHTHTFIGTAVSIDHTHNLNGSNAIAVSNGAHTHTPQGWSREYAISSTSERFALDSGTEVNNWSRKTDSKGAHTHTLSGNTAVMNSNKTVTAKGNNSNSGGGGSHAHSIPKQTTGAASNLMPYITCYMWKRVS